MQRGILISDLKFMLSDNWWIEGESAWFCAGEINALFYVDLNTQQCKFIAQIPIDEMQDFVFYSYCAKYDETVFCIPNFGECIWCYNIKQNTWNRIEIENKYQTLMCQITCIQNGNQVWFLNAGGNIFRIDLQRQIVERTYQVAPFKNEINGEYILQQNRFYCVSENKVYCIDVSTSNITTYELIGVKVGLLTICYDGANFWLAGLQKEIYVWNPEYGVVKVITEFPEQFGIYTFGGNESFLLDYDLDIKSTEGALFYTTSVAIGNYIWYIPWQANQIIYIDKENYEVRSLEIEEEQETEDSLKREITAKYAVEYIRENRYLGLYSYKNREIFEIDTEELCVKRKKYHLCIKSILPLARIAAERCNNEGVFRENQEYASFFYEEMIKNSSESRQQQIQNIGDIIYHTIN